MQAEFSWHPAEKHLIRKKFESRAGIWLKNSFSRARERGKPPGWIGKDLWKRLLVKFAEPEFLRTCEKNKRNRVANPESASTMYRGGSKSMMEHHKELVSLSIIISSSSLSILVLKFDANIFFILVGEDTEEEANTDGNV